MILEDPVRNATRDALPRGPALTARHLGCLTLRGKLLDFRNYDCGLRDCRVMRSAAYAVSTRCQRPTGSLSAATSFS